jgi:hypothetical protein
MPKGDSRDAIASAVTTGIMKAASSWESMSGEALSHAPEYYTSAVIAQTLSKSLEKSWICLEWGTALTLREARHVPKRGRPRTRLDGSKRFDLVVFYQDSRPRSVIEVKHLISNGVKNRFNKQGLHSDFSRVAHAVAERSSAKSSLAQGCLAIYLECGETTRRDGSAKERIVRWMDELETWARENISNFANHRPLVFTHRRVKETEGAGGAYGAFVIDLRVPKRRTSTE